MIEGGEDVKFIARRLIISAAEDIGLANPNALMLANETFSAVERWLARKPHHPQSVYYISSYFTKIEQAPTRPLGMLRNWYGTRNLEVPDHLKNASSALAKDLGHGKRNLYPHDYQKGFIQQEYLPKELKGTVFWIASSNAKEQQISAQQKRCGRTNTRLTQTYFGTSVQCPTLLGII